MSTIQEKLKKIEALIASTNMQGERAAAEAAIKRILEQVSNQPPQHVDTIEFTLSSGNMWNKKLILALCGKYDLRPYRYYRQKYTTVMVRCNEQFMKQVFWPEYQKFSDLLDGLINDIAVDLIAQIHHGVEEVEVAGELGDGKR